MDNGGDKGKTKKMKNSSSMLELYKTWLNSNPPHQESHPKFHPICSKQAKSQQSDHVFRPTNHTKNVKLIL